MAYTPKTWTCGEIITADDLNHIEQGIANSGGGSEAPIITMHGVNIGAQDETYYITEEDANKARLGYPMAFKFAQVMDGDSSSSILAMFLNLQTAVDVVYKGSFEGIDMTMRFAFEDAINVIASQGSTVVAQHYLEWDESSRRYVTNRSA